MTGPSGGRTLATTVTYLALDGLPAALPPMPTRPRLALMQAEAIAAHYYRYLYAEVGKSLLWVERSSLSDADLLKRIHAVGTEIFVLYANGNPAGYFELDRQTAGNVRLAYFGLMPEWTGQRIGPWFLGAAIAAGFSRGARRLAVNTCTFDHPAALPLYQKLGFRPVRREERMLSVPPEVPIPDHIAARLLM
jgi:GNAT superfamily N-acetyltransferase